MKIKAIQDVFSNQLLSCRDYKDRGLPPVHIRRVYEKGKIYDAKPANSLFRNFKYELWGYFINMSYDFITEKEFNTYFICLQSIRNKKIDDLLGLN